MHGVYFVMVHFQTAMEIYYSRKICTGISLINRYLWYFTPDSWRI